MVLLLLLLFFFVKNLLILRVPNRTLSGACPGVTVVVFVGKLSEFLLVVIFVVVDLQNSLKVQCRGILYLPSISVRNLTWIISSRNKTVS